MKLTRNVRFRDLFNINMLLMKNQYGSGVYSWAQGMNRRTARAIARKVSREGKRIPERSAL